MAGFATGGLAGLVARLHPLFELAMVDVFVAACATELREVVEHNRVGRCRLVAVVAGHGDVAAIEWEVALFVHFDVVVRHLPLVAVVALLAAVAPRVGSELSLVLILVAIQAGCKLHLVFRVLAAGTGGLVAIRTLQVGVRRNERVLGLGVIRSRECGWAPALHGVAAFATTLVRALRELSPMLILVAIGTRLESNLGFEIAALVAVNARYLPVLSNQWVVGLGVIELARKGRSRPRRGSVARFAGLFELALVGIGVAIHAKLEFESGVAWLPIVAWRVALGARRGHVLARQRIAGLGVIECLLIELGALPRCGVVALQAVGAETALVLVLVARSARGTKPHPGVVELLFAQQRAGGRSDVLGGVAIAASGGCVFPIQDIAGLGVVEALHRRVPVEHVEVFAVVVGVALYAGRAGRAGQRIGGMQAVVALHLGGNLAVTLGAPE